MAGRVLVVDDEKMIVKGLKFSLMQDYSVVDCAYDGVDATETLKNEIKKFKKVLTSKRLSDKIIFADAVKKQQSGSRENNRFCAER